MASTLIGDTSITFAINLSFVHLSVDLSPIMCMPYHRPPAHISSISLNMDLSPSVVVGDRGWSSLEISFHKATSFVGSSNNAYMAWRNVSFCT